MNRLLLVGTLLISTAPLFAQDQQPDMAKLKADAQKVVSIIGGDKAKSQTYCHILDLSEELDQLDELKDRKKTEDLSQKISELEKTLGPEYLALGDRLKDMDPTSRGGQEIGSIVERLYKSCED
ncbi:MAG: hypothetical protein WB689_24100 [Xanthobacteraceae bacterium]